MTIWNSIETLTHNNGEVEQLRRLLAAARDLPVEHIGEACRVIAFARSAPGREEQVQAALQLREVSLEEAALAGSETRPVEPSPEAAPVTVVPAAPSPVTVVPTAPVTEVAPATVVPVAPPVTPPVIEQPQPTSSESASAPASSNG